MRRTGAALGALVLLAACSPQQVEAQAADYPAYSSLAELCDAATLVVSGSPVGSEVRTVDLRTGDEGGTAEENPGLGAGGTRPEDEAVVTVTSFQVDAVVAGRAIGAGERIEVSQMGGELDGVDHPAAQFPLDDGGTYLLFLEEFDDAPAVLLNPTEAGYVVSPSGAIVSDAGTPLGDEMDGQTVDASLCG